MMKMKLKLVTLWLTIVCMTWWPARSSAEDVIAENRFDVTLFNGDHVFGALADCDEASTLAVKLTDFVDPFRFPIQPISHVSRLGKIPRPLSGPLRFVLTDRSNLIGELVGLTPNSITIDSSIFGRVELARDQVSRIMRRSHEDVQLAGGGRLQDGTDPAQAWKQTMGTQLPQAEKLLLKEPSTFISGEGVLPEQCEISIAISWLDKPNFAIAFTEGDAGTLDVASIESWQDKLVMVLESSDAARTQFISESLKPNHRLELVIYLDRLNDRICLFTPSGRMLADHKLIGERPLPTARLKLTNYTTDNARFGLRVDSLTVRHWNGRLPDAASGKVDVASFSKADAAQPDQARQSVEGQSVEGETVQGELENYDATTGMLAFQTAGGSQQLPLARLEHLSFGSENKRASDDILMLLEDAPPAIPAIAIPPDAAQANGTKPTEALADQNRSNEDSGDNANIAAPELHLSVQLIDGSGLLGKLVSLREGRMNIELLGSHAQIHFAIADLASIQVVARSSDIEAWAKARVAQLSGLESIINTDTSRLTGSLVDSEGEGVLRWRPHYAKNASVIVPATDGTISFDKQNQSNGSSTAARNGTVDRNVQRPAAMEAVQIVADPGLAQRRAAVAEQKLQVEFNALQNQIAAVMARARAIDNVEDQRQEMQKVRALLDARERLLVQITNQRNLQNNVEAPPVQNAAQPAPGIIGGNRVIAGGVRFQAFNVANGLVVRNGMLVPSSPVSVERLGEVGLTFRSGDQIAGTVTRIDKRGITFQSDATTTTFANHDQLDSVVLLFKWNEQRTDPVKLKRLLTVPRSMKSDPPTHLIVSASGDYLRGRLQRMDEHELLIDVSGEQVHVKRDEVAKIFWLYQRDWTDPPAMDSSTKPTDNSSVSPASQSNGAANSETSHAATASSTDVATQAQAMTVHILDRAGRPLTFVPRSLTGKTLKGFSQILNDCTIELDQISRIYYARDIEPLVASRRSDSWKLSAARTPRAFETSEDDDQLAGPSSGNASPLVGKPAPPILLKDMNDQPWQLANHQGRVVVLDFWASWCGPCMQAMPAVERVVTEAGNGKVDLIAVNLQESKAKVTAALERLQISPTVVLDAEGRAARDYQARAIPQTVIIDASGVVTHVFVGGGKRTLADLETALKAMVTP